MRHLRVDLKLQWTVLKVLSAMRALQRPCSPLSRFLRKNSKMLEPCWLTMRIKQESSCESFGTLLRRVKLDLQVPIALSRAYPKPCT